MIREDFMIFQYVQRKGTSRGSISERERERETQRLAMPHPLDWGMQARHLRFRAAN